MKFFTRQLYDALQGDFDSEEFDRASDEWDEACERYRHYLDSIKSQLPESVHDFYETSLHDGSVKSAVFEDGEVRIQIDASGCINIAGDLELIFHDVKSVKGLDDIIDDDWLYDEVHLSEEAAFELRVLLDNSEFHIAAGSVELTGVIHQPQDLRDLPVFFGDKLFYSPYILMAGVIVASIYQRDPFLLFCLLGVYPGWSQATPGIYILNGCLPTLAMILGFLLSGLNEYLLYLGLSYGISWYIISAEIGITIGNLFDDE